VQGVGAEDASALVRSLRERTGGLPGLRALALPLPQRGAVQISMNLERVEDNAPMEVFRRIEAAVADVGGTIVETEVIGMLPDRLVADAAAERLRLRGETRARLLSRGLAAYLAERESGVGAHE
jgi:glutamate formiminotransferase